VGAAAARRTDKGCETIARPARSQPCSQASCTCDSDGDRVPGNTPSSVSTQRSAPRELRQAERVALRVNKDHSFFGWREIDLDRVQRFAKHNARAFDRDEVRCVSGVAGGRLACRADGRLPNVYGTVVGTRTPDVVPALTRETPQAKKK